MFVILVIEEANWLSLTEDLSHNEIPEASFDAVLCLGNSFAHLPDFEGHQEQQKLALSNFRDMVKPGGIMVVDHRNYDFILKTGEVPKKNIYYNVRRIYPQITIRNVTRSMRNLFKIF